MVERYLWFLRSYFMARKIFRRSGSGGPGPTQKAWAIAYENMEIRRNSSYLVVKLKQTRNGHGGAVTMVP